MTEVLTGELDMNEQVADALRALDVSQFAAWRSVEGSLPDARVFAVDFDPNDFRVGSDGAFEGLADILLTYRGSFLGTVDQSVTLPATVFGTVGHGGAKVTDIRIALG